MDLPLTTFLYFNSKVKVAPGKINHRNVIKSCQIVFFSSKSAIERLSSSIEFADLPGIPTQNNGRKTPIFVTQCFLTNY